MGIVIRDESRAPVAKARDAAASRAALAPVLERFREGFGTAGLTAARALLDSL